jgi:hypothetical protein
MPQENSTTERFSLTFDGDALERHQIRASELAQSLLALDVLAEKAASAQCGKKAHAEMNVEGGFRPGSFIVDLVLYYEPVINTTEALVSAVAVIAELIKAGLWLKGTHYQKAEKIDGGRTAVYNNNGQMQVFNNCTVSLLCQPRIKSQLDRLTAVLDNDGVECISLKQNASEIASVSKKDRDCFKLGRGRTLSYSEDEMTLQVLTAQLEDPTRQWRFSEGEDQSFNAVVEDQAFLDQVRRGECSFKNGTMIRAVVRKVQRMTSRLSIERTVVEVLDVL